MGTERLSRQLRLVLALAESPRGLSSEKLAGALDCSRATVNRDLRMLRQEVGLRIEPTRVSGEVWHRLDGVPLQLAVTPVQLAALGLARAALAPLAGTAILRELDVLALGAPTSAAVRLFGARAPAATAILATLDRAITTGYRVTIHTRVASRGGERRTYAIEPITVRLLGGEAYLDAWSVEKDALRTFKVARIESAVLSEERARPHSDVDLEAVFRAAVKTWSGEPLQVRIRIAPEAAWAVSEYPLVAGQRVTSEPDGAVLIDAEVAGLVETTRWILGWGRHAEAVSPPALRERLQAELRDALDGYGASPVRSSIVSGPEVPAASASAPTGPRSTTRTTPVRGE